MPLRFDSDLVVSVDGLEGRVVGDGATLRLETSDPARFVDELRAAGPSDTRSLARAAEFLHDRGVTVVLAGPHGDVVTAGAGVASLLGRVTAGSARIRPGRARAVRPLVRGQLRQAGRDRRLRVAVVVALVLAVLRLVRGRAGALPSGG